MKIKIKVTKDVLRRSMMCGVNGGLISKNCGIAVAVQEIFPNCQVTYDGDFGHLPVIYLGWERKIKLPKEAEDFMKAFDKLEETPSERLNLPEISFDIDVPDNIIQSIGISQVYKVLSESKTLEWAPNLADTL